MRSKPEPITRIFLPPLKEMTKSAHRKHTFHHITESRVCFLSPVQHVRVLTKARIQAERASYVIGVLELKAKQAESDIGIRFRFMFRDQVNEFILLSDFIRELFYVKPQTRMDEHSFFSLFSAKKTV